jgi:hypothetical protein
MTAPPRRLITQEIAIKNYEKNLKLNSVLHELRPENDPLSDSSYLLSSQDQLYNMESNTENHTQAQKKRLQGRMKTYFAELRSFFSDKNYWKAFWKSLKDIFVAATDEKLVDSRVLSWAYIEAGVIECTGALFAFFAVLWIEFDISPTVARRGQIKGGMFWKPHSPDLIREDGSAVV